MYPFRISPHYLSTSLQSLSISLSLLSSLFLISLLSLVVPSLSLCHSLSLSLYLFYPVILSYSLFLNKDPLIAKRQYLSPSLYHPLFFFHSSQSFLSHFPHILPLSHSFFSFSVRLSLFLSVCLSLSLSCSLSNIPAPSKPTHSHAKQITDKHKCINACSVINNIIRTPCIILIPPPPLLWCVS